MCFYSRKSKTTSFNQREEVASPGYSPSVIEIITHEEAQLRLNALKVNIWKPTHYAAGTGYKKKPSVLWLAKDDDFLLSINTTDHYGVELCQSNSLSYAVIISNEWSLDLLYFARGSRKRF